MALAFDRITGSPFASRSEVIATQGMAATSQPIASQVAIDILKKGGSAVDAAIAANAVLALVEPTGCGLGGDLYAIVWDQKSRKLHGLNASGRSPKSLTLTELKKQGLTKIPSFGPLPVSVPGAVDGWFELHKKFGRLPMKDVLAPAIDYARQGFPVSELIAYYWERNARYLKPYPNFKETFMPEGRTPRKGEIFKNPDLAKTLDLIAKKGRDEFYKGGIAKIIARYMKEQDGYLSYDDLANHSSDWVEPVSVEYRGFRLWELPPNGQGIAALQILQILKQFDSKDWSLDDPNYIHTFVEAKKLAFEDRARYYADLDFYKTPVKTLISESYAKRRAKLIDPNRAAKSFKPDPKVLEEGDTIYLSTADRDGNMVSLIQSNYRGMGSGMTPTGLGFILQDRGELFSLNEGEANTYAPGKRPFHTIIPAFITKNNKPFMAYGVMGGATQPQAHVQIMMNMIHFGANLQEAGDFPRILHRGSSQPTGERMDDGGVVSLESGFSAETRRELSKRGHQLQWNVGSFGGYQAIMRDDNGVYYGASESRKDGAAIGY
ncbi:gamma-glutamyltransferase [Pseudobacteriovorax antillogorgiicola]